MQLLEDYLNSILGRVHPLPPTELPIDQALDHVLVDDLVARFAVPPFSNSGMDGYALHLDHDLEASLSTPSPSRSPVTLQLETTRPTFLNRVPHGAS